MLLKFLILFLNFCLVFSFEKSIAISEFDEDLETEKPSSLISVRTELGRLIGYKKNVQNQTINVFYGVPYAEPPVGKLRFRRTKLIHKFPQEPYTALQFKPHCAQKLAKKYNPNDLFAEDCLYMNIWSPNLDQFKINGICLKKFKTMVYILGGTSSIYQMSPLLDANNKSHLSYSGDLFPVHDTILVTFNFRLELFSTLYLHDKFNGNLGYFDQNLAIQWTKKYIKDFCGDEEDLTLFGNSYGSMATGLQIISRYSKNLISNAIMQSSSPLFQESFPLTQSEIMINSFSAIKNLKCVDLKSSRITNYINKLDEKIRRKFFDDRNLLEANKFLLELSKNFDKFKSNLKIRKDDQDYLDRDLINLIKFLSKYAVDEECLQNIPMQQLIDVDKSYLNQASTFYFDFDFFDTDAYINYKLYNRLNLNPKINILIGFLSDEQCSQGLLFKELYPTDKFNPPAMKKKDAVKIIRELGFLKSMKEDKISKIMADYYTDESRWHLPKGYYESIVNLLSDWQYACPTQFFSTSAAKTANTVSSYFITQPATKHFGSSMYQYDLDDFNWLGPCHADELSFLFGMPFRAPNQFSDADRSFSKLIVNLWTSFAKDGRMPNQKPSGKKWPISNKRSPLPKYVEINSKYVREYDFEFEERCEQFWRPLLPFYKR